MTYEPPRVERVQLLGQMLSPQSRCELRGGTWDGNDCNGIP